MIGQSKIASTDEAEKKLQKRQKARDKKLRPRMKVSGAGLKKLREIIVKK